MSNGIFTSPETRDKILFILAVSAFLFVVEVVNIALGHGLASFGSYPREVIGLTGIFTSPFLHGNFNHFVSNIGPFMILGGFVVWKGISHFIKISFAIMVATGTMVWTFGPSGTIVIGASGVIFGYLGYLIGRAFFERGQSDILIALFVFIFYGGMILGVLPGTPGVSWQAHLFGFLSGIGASLLWRKQ